MCGIAGVIAVNVPNLSQAAKGMVDKLSHRGPDDAGVWVDSKGRVALGHRRLSILDVSKAGSQPMLSSCGKYCIVYNGEIYNHIYLRSVLESELNSVIPWRSNSDTETLLYCFSHWGVERTLSALVGMFALALYDIENCSLVLARDRVGEKPLYWGFAEDGGFLFASELKAIKSYSGFNPSVNRGALALYVRHGYVPSPYCIYDGMRKLMPGHYLTLSVSDIVQGSLDATPHAYWQYNSVVEEGLAHQFRGSTEQAISTLETVLTQSIESQLVADVPVGAFLSGGVDSSTVVSLMQKCSDKPVRTFTIGFENAGYNEALDARKVAEHLGTDHTELTLNAADALSVVPKISEIYCEPFADSSQIPTYLVSKLARESVAVALSGDGGDELFGGYNRYLAANRIWHPMRRLPRFIRTATAASLEAFSPSTWDAMFDVLRPILPRSLHVSIPGEKAKKLSSVLRLDSDSEFYRSLTSFLDPSDLLLVSEEPPTLVTSPESWPRTDCFEHFMMALDAKTYMTEDILTKVDRAAMACSLETRVPMLDHRVIEQAWKFPIDFKIRKGKGKWLLRQVLYKHVPQDLIDRPKMGFGIPLGSWLRGELKPWADSLLSESRLQKDGYFNVEYVRRMWEQHLTGKYDWQHQLWIVLMFQSWLDAGA